MRSELIEIERKGDRLAWQQYADAVRVAFDRFVERFRA
jgi:hypothetical protein